MKLVRARVDRRFQNRVSLANELHVAVFDAVVDHLHVMPRTVGTHMSATRLIFRDGGDLRINRGERFPAFLRSAGHDRWAFERAFFAAADADSKEMDSLFFEVFLAALSVGPEGIAAIDDDVAGFHQRNELLDDGINGRAGFDHDLGFARTGECSDELGQCLGEDEVFSFAASGFKRLDDAGGAVENGDLEAAAFHVENEVFAHDGEADEADVTLIHNFIHSCG